MSMLARLDEALKTAMRARDARMLDLVRMLKSRIIEARTAADFKGEVDDALVMQVIASYGKAQQKALSLFESAGDAGKAHIEQIEWELATLAQWLPQKADEATTRGYVEAAIAAAGGPGKANIGRVMGLIMKAHKDDVDPAVARRIADEMLAG